nr:MAG TPA: hypothetical protein [Caudoviricetes sp.]
MKDRIPLYPGRVKLTAVDGQPGVYDMVRADEATEQGTPLSKATLLDDDTAESYGLDKDTAVPNDAFKLINKLLVGPNRYVTVTVKTEGGAPIPDVEITGITTVSGGIAKTDATGTVFGVAAAEQTTIAAAKQYTDINIPSQTITTPAGKFTAVTLIGTLIDFVAFETTATVIMSPLATRVDVSLVGGGNGGNPGTVNPGSSSGHSGAGGDGGKIATFENVDFSANVEYTAQIGAGGTKNGGVGGDTGVFGKTSASGQQAKGGGYRTSTANGIAGGDGSPAFISFTETELFGGAGGGGAYGSNKSGGAGGAGGGGAGGGGAENGESATKPGGGSGGGGSIPYMGEDEQASGYGPAGKSGYIGMRIYH